MKLGFISSKDLQYLILTKGLIHETLANFDEQSTQQRGRKREDQSWSQRCLGTKSCSGTPHQLQEAHQKGI